MGRKPVPQPLELADAAASSGQDPPPCETLPISSPSDSKSPRSPRSPFRFAQKKAQKAGGKQPLRDPEVPPQQQQHQQQPGQPRQQHQKQQAQQQQQKQQPQQQPPRQSPQPQEQRLQHRRPQQEEAPFSPISPSHDASSTQPSQSHGQQNQSHGHRRRDEDKASKSGFFFHFAKSSDRINQYASSPRRETMSRDTDRPDPSKKPKQADPTHQDETIQRPIPSLPSKTDLSLSPSNLSPASEYDKKGKPKPFNLLGRTRSFKDQDGQNSREEGVPAEITVTEPERAHTAGPLPLRTAPIHAHDRSFREMMSSAVRNHSAERPQHQHQHQHHNHHPRDRSGSKGREPERDQGNRAQASSLRDNGGGSAFFSGLKSSSSRAADMISKGLFGKATRSGSTTEKEPIVDDEHYVLKVINLPLLEQTRRTRISKRLEDSRDKTEFWMPAFPWRAIDYLNYKGSDVEGLYRVPGSGPQIKKWQRRFDEEGDVDLFLQNDLYDINIIGSMLKAWLRELPDELFPKEAQDRIARECAGSETVPQLLIDELSNLSPFNYYLLFAITCHLSLLLAHSDKNKMDFRNLCICFQPCMKIDAFCFKFLVCDWRDCWKGCKNEAKYIEEEYALFNQSPPPTAAPTIAEPAHDNEAAVEERNISSSGSSKQSNRSGTDNTRKPRLKKKTVPSAENASVETSSTVSTTLTVNSGRETPPRSDLRPLSPIKPLSPLGF